MKRDGCLQVAAVLQQEPRGLFELETTVAHNLTVDLDVHAISSNSERARAQIVDVLTAINSEVGACVNGACVNALVDLLVTSCARSVHSDGRRPRGNSERAGNANPKGNCAV